MIKNDEFGAEEIFLAPETVSSDAVSGEEREPVGAADGDAPLTLENEPEQAVRVGEIAALRGENRKVYRMSDGTEQAVFYAEPIHAFNADTNTYDNVENTLAEEEDGRHIIGGRHAFIARFSREEENDELFSVENGRHRIAVFAGNTGGRKAQNFRVKACRKTAADAGGKRRGRFSGRAKRRRLCIFRDRKRRQGEHYRQGTGGHLPVCVCPPHGKRYRRI